MEPAERANMYKIRWVCRQHPAQMVHCDKKIHIKYDKMQQCAPCSGDSGTVTVHQPDSHCWHLFLGENISLGDTVLQTCLQYRHRVSIFLAVPQYITQEEYIRLCDLALCPGENVLNQSSKPAPQRRVHDTHHPSYNSCTLAIRLTTYKWNLSHPPSTTRHMNVTWIHIARRAIWIHVTFM